MPASGRPVSFWLRFEEIEDIDAAAREVNMSRSEWVKLAISRQLASPPTPSRPAPVLGSAAT